MVVILEKGVSTDITALMLSHSALPRRKGGFSDAIKKDDCLRACSPGAILLSQCRFALCC
jgi:hypothetical protein